MSGPATVDPKLIVKDVAEKLPVTGVGNEPTPPTAEKPSMPAQSIPIPISQTGVATMFPVNLSTLMQLAAGAGQGMLKGEIINEFEDLAIDWMEQNFPSPQPGEASAQLALPSHIKQSKVWPASARSQDVFKACTLLHVLLTDLKNKFNMVQKAGITLQSDKIQTQEKIYVWLGAWRDKLPPEAVTALQDILGPLVTNDPAFENQAAKEGEKK